MQFAGNKSPEIVPSYSSSDEGMTTRKPTSKLHFGCIGGIFTMLLRMVGIDIPRVTHHLAGLRNAAQHLILTSPLSRLLPHSIGNVRSSRG